MQHWWWMCSGLANSNESRWLNIMLTKENCFITGATLILRWSCFLFFVLIVVVNFPKRDQTLQIRRSNHGLGSFANSTQLILWNYWELRMSGGGYAMHRLLVLRFILRSGNLVALLHHSDFCVKLSRHMFAFVLLQETCFPNCRSRQFFS